MKVAIPMAMFLVLSFGCRSVRDRSKALSEVEPTAARPTAPVEAEGIGDIFRYNYGPRNKDFPKPAVRAAFRRTIGCAKAKFQVVDSLEAPYAQGIFSAPKEYEAWVRVGRDRTAPTGVDDFDRSTVAISVKLMPGPAGDLPPTERLSGEHDFILQNHHVFFVDTAEEFLLAFMDPSILNAETLRAVYEKFGVDGQSKITQEQKDRTERILNAMTKDAGNSLRTTYWSVTPYRYGSTFAKYRFVPVRCDAGNRTPLSDEALPTDRNQSGYLRDRFLRDLKSESACFELQAQLHDGKPDESSATPVDRATVAWDETRFPPRTVARLSLLPVANGSEAIDNACEAMRFNPRNAPSEHAPAGSINEARAFIYERFFSCRQKQNAGDAGKGDFAVRCLPNPR